MSYLFVKLRIHKDIRHETRHNVMEGFEHSVKDLDGVAINATNDLTKSRTVK